MNAYLALKGVHALLAVVSGLYFAGRGIWRLGLRRPIEHRMWKTLPHLIDTLLLASGVALAIWIGLRPTVVPWFGIKLVAVVVYILLGVVAFRTASRGISWTAFAMALGVWLWIIGMALNKHAAAWMAGWL